MDEPLPTVGPSLRRRIVGGAAISLTGSAGWYLSNLVVNAVVARLLPPRETASFFLAQTIAQSAIAVAHVGVTGVAVRLVAESLAKGEPGRARDVIRAVLRAGWVALAIAVVIALPPTRQALGSIFSSTRIGAVAPLIGAMLVLRTLTVQRTNVFRGFHEIGRAVVLGQLLGPVLSAVGLGGLWLFARDHATLRIVLGLAVGAWVPAVVIATVLLRRRIARLEGPGHAGQGEIARLAAPLIVASLSWLALQQAHFLVVGAALPAGVIARYGAAMRLANILNTPLQIAVFVTSASVAELWAQGRREQVSRLVRAMSTAALGLMAGPTLLFVLAGGFVLRVIFGPFYAGGASLLAVMCIGQVIQVGTGQAADTLVMTGHQRTVMICNLVGSTVGIVGAVLSVGPLGAMGPATFWVIGWAVENVLQVLAARRLVGIWTVAGIRPALDELRILRERRR